jgi:hypothetical protein
MEYTIDREFAIANNHKTVKSSDPYTDNGGEFCEWCIGTVWPRRMQYKHENSCCSGYGETVSYAHLVGNPNSDLQTGDLVDVGFDAVVLRVMGNHVIVQSAASGLSSIFPLCAVKAKL